MKRKIFLYVTILCLIFCLTGCKKKHLLSLNSEYLSGSVSLATEMYLVEFLDDHLLYLNVYQEKTNPKDKEDKVLDTLIIKADYATDDGVASYAQKSINQLKNNGYKISNEKSKKITIFNNDKGTEYKGVLKTYHIKNDLYPYDLLFAHYFFDGEGKIITISYATSQKSHRKKFINSVTKNLFLVF